MRAVVGKWAWLYDMPLTEMNNLEDRLTLTITSAPGYGKQRVEKIRMFARGSDGAFGVPRSFFFSDKTLSSIERTVVVSDGEPLSDDVQSEIEFTGPYEEGGIAVRKLLDVASLRRGGGCILQAEPGTGKTVMGLSFAYQYGRKTLILVHKDFFIDQWTKRIKQFLPGAVIGVIKQDKCIVEGADFVLASISSLTGDRWKKYPPEVFEMFGLVISDETHRLGASSWSTVITKFSSAFRLGLTATPYRKDGATDVFLNHIGPIAVKLKSSSLIPKIRRLIIDTKIDSIFVKKGRGGYTIPAIKMKPPHFISALASTEQRSRYIAEVVSEAVKAGRKVMVVSERLEHLRVMGIMLKELLEKEDLSFTPMIGYYTGEWFVKKIKDDEEIEVLRKRTRAELDHAERCNVIFTTKQMTSEGLDIPALDVVVLTIPMGDVEQVVGRIRRRCRPDEQRRKCRKMCPWRAQTCNGKPDPIVVDVVDRFVIWAMTKWKQRAKYYVSIDAMPRKKSLI